MSFITCKKKSAANCLPIAYHPLLVALPPTPLPPPPLPAQYISSPPLLSSLTHSTLRSAAERHRLTFNAIISVCLSVWPPACLPLQPATCHFFIYPPLFAHLFCRHSVAPCLLTISVHFKLFKYVQTPILSTFGFPSVLHISCQMEFKMHLKTGFYSSFTRMQKKKT